MGGAGKMWAATEGLFHSTVRLGATRPNRRLGRIAQGEAAPRPYKNVYDEKTPH